VLAACGSLLLSGCGLLAGPQRLAEDPPLNMTVTVPVLKAGAVLPAEFTCYARRVFHHGHAQPIKSPPISWSGAPQGTRSLAVVVDDSSTPIDPRVYWIVFDIGADTTDLQVGTLPPQARVAQNTAHRAAYDPPCPQGASHKYRVTVYALNTRFGRGLPDHAPLLQAWTTISAHVIGRGTTPVKVLPGN
jgi:Raf kinase inhibitor-like YbhB/YbcL family protein